METTKEEPKTKKEKLVRVEVELNEPVFELAILAKLSHNVVRDIPRMNDATDEEEEMAFSAVFGALRAAYAMGKDTAQIKSKWEKVNAISSTIGSILLCLMCAVFAAYGIIGICVKFA